MVIWETNGNSSSRSHFSACMYMYLLDWTGGTTSSQLFDNVWWSCSWGSWPSIRRRAMTFAIVVLPWNVKKHLKYLNIILLRCSGQSTFFNWVIFKFFQSNQLCIYIYLQNDSTGTEYHEKKGFSWSDGSWWWWRMKGIKSQWICFQRKEVKLTNVNYKCAILY